MEQYPSPNRIESTPKVETGEYAKVTIHEDTVTMEPNGFIRDQLNKKMDKQKIFNELTSNIEGLEHAKILSEDRTRERYTVERAKGIPLLETDPSNEESFFDIPNTSKVKALQTYLKAVEALNENGYTFQDHKADSIFIQKNGNITIVDAGSIMELDGTKADILKERGIGSNGKFSQFEETLSSFFTKSRIPLNEEDDNQLMELIPHTIFHFLQQCTTGKIQTAKELREKIDAYMNGKHSLIPPENPDFLIRTQIKAADVRKETDGARINFYNNPNKNHPFEIDNMLTIIHKEALRKRGRLLTSRKH